MKQVTRLCKQSEMLNVSRLCKTSYSRKTLHEMRVNERSSRTWRATWSKVKKKSRWEVEDSLLSHEDGMISIVSIAELSRDDGGYSSFVVIDTRRSAEVADAARFAEQTKKERSQRGRFEDEMNRTTDPRISQVSASEVRDVTQKKILELEGAIWGLTGRAQQQGGFNIVPATRQSTHLSPSPRPFGKQLVERPNVGAKWQNTWRYDPLEKACAAARRSKHNNPAPKLAMTCSWSSSRRKRI